MPRLAKDKPFFSGLVRTRGISNLALVKFGGAAAYDSRSDGNALQFTALWLA